MDKTIKKAIAGLLALTLVIGAMPANSKGFFKELLIYDSTGVSRSLYFDLDGNFVDVDLDD